MARRGAFWIVVVVSTAASSACTQRTPWSGEGTLGEACFPDQTCNAGFDCVGGRCASDPAVLPEAGPVIAADGGRAADAGAPTDQALSCPEIPSPKLDHPTYTPHESAPIRARSPGAVAFDVTRGGGQTARLQTDGRLCHEVALDPESTVQVEVVAIDAHGCRSRPATATITHQPLGSANLIDGVEAVTDSDTEQPMSWLTDGETQKRPVKFKFFDPLPGCNKYVYVWFDLGEPREVESMKVYYPPTPDFGGYLGCWDLLASAVDDPDDPGPQNGEWTALAKADKGKAANLTINVKPTTTRHVALLMYSDGSPTPLYESLALTEIEIWGKPPLPPYEGCE